VAVEAGAREAEARRLNEAFCLSIAQGRAFVHLKLAATLDGKIATRTGDSRWVSSEESRQRVHVLRDRCQAIVVGVGTAAADDPRLTVRLPGQPERRVLRVVLDPRLRLPPDRFLVSEGEAAHTLVACGPHAPRDSSPLAAQGVEVLRLPETAGGRLDLGALLRDLYGRGMMEVLVEGGAVTARDFLDQGLADRVHLFLSPRLLGGSDAVPLVGGRSPERMGQAWSLAEMEVERVGPDLYLTGRPAPGTAS
jgi:diaminohydroxyphosphoribosylaminopyrimidine deaminase/5-amino-6-(5-phosphoribosylamino)uracil reductase